MAMLLAILIVVTLLTALMSLSNSERFGWVGRVIGILVLAGLAVLFVLPAVIPKPREKSIRVRCMSNLSQIGKACALYAADHNDQYPDSFSQLTNYVDNPGLFICREGHSLPGSMKDIDAWTSYILVTNVSCSNVTQVLAYCPRHIAKGGATVLHTDCSVEWISTAGFPSLGVDITNLSRAATNSAILR